MILGARIAGLPVCRPAGAAMRRARLAFAGTSDPLDLDQVVVDDIENFDEEKLF